jgi:hypothetical protein
MAQTVAEKRWQQRARCCRRKRGTEGETCYVGIGNSPVNAGVRHRRGSSCVYIRWQQSDLLKDDGENGCSSCSSRVETNLGFRPTGRSCIWAHSAMRQAWSFGGLARVTEDV